MYYLGTDDIPVKPVTRRLTFRRGQNRKRSFRYLQKKGRKPINRFAYPTMGTPVAALEMSREPGQFGDDSAPVYGPFLPIPAVPPVPAIPTQPNLITSLLNLWNDRPQILKDIKLNVNPNQLVAAAQTVVKPSQVGGFVDILRSWGIEPSYKGVPITGQVAATGYQVYGMNLSQYIPWIIGGGAALLILPRLMKR